MDVYELGSEVGDWKKTAKDMEVLDACERSNEFCQCIKKG